MMVSQLSFEVRAVIRKAASRLTGFKRRLFVAEMAISSLPVPRSLRRLINRRGYSLRKVRKTKPLKKIPETNEIFDNIQATSNTYVNRKLPFIEKRQRSLGPNTENKA